jgi:hypothetical protein
VISSDACFRSVRQRIEELERGIEVVEAVGLA